MYLRKLRIHLLRLAFIPVIFVAVFVRPPWSMESAAGFTMELIGYMCLLAGLVIRIWCIFYIGSRKSKELIAEGPYSICRNPLYVGTFFLAIGVGLCFENSLIVLLVPAIIVPIHIIVAKMEETNLENIFGDQYRTYKQKVPRFWPKFSNYTSAETLAVNVRSIKRIAFDTAGILFIPYVEDMLELLHEHGVIPVLWHFPF
ncbi:MAG: isoprenylcysteine carboxylmethyltransferase family protein [Phycisphaerae bacterium]|nr:isoprenylcysteine carboxylmethyltransferase family protein [Phycisphaerae bacterium]